MNRPDYTYAANHFGFNQYFNRELVPVCIECEKSYVNSGSGAVCQLCETDSLPEVSTQS